MLIGSHVSFKKDTQILGSLEEALSYNSTCFMFYTGAPQNTNRNEINLDITNKALELMKKNNIDIKNIIVHAPYIINLGNKENIGKYKFSIFFLIEECKRCENLGISKMVLHPGNHLNVGIDNAINAISDGLNEILKNTTITILLETMAGKGTEVGSNLEELKKIIDKIDKQNQIGICLDTCHLFDSGYNLTNLEELINELKKYDLLSKVGCIHINDSKNTLGSKKDRHENLGFGNIGFDTLINIIYHEEFKNIPKILETPWIFEYPPYKLEIEMIKNKKFDELLKEKVKNL